MTGVHGQQWNVTYASTSVTASVGSTAHLSCSYTFPPHLTFKKAFWTLAPKQPPLPDLALDPLYVGRVKLDCRSGTQRCDLDISALNTSDSGTYYCRVETTAEKEKYVERTGVELHVTVQSSTTSSPTTQSAAAEVQSCDSTSQRCHDSATCVTTETGFYCECRNSDTLSLNENGTLVCNEVQNQDSELSQFDHLVDTMKNLTNMTTLSKPVVLSYLKALEAKLLAVSSDTSPEQLADVGNKMVVAIEKLVGALVEPTSTQGSKTLKTNSTEVHILIIGKDTSIQTASTLSSTNVLLDIDLLGIAKNNGGAAAVSLVTLSNMSAVLRADLFSTANDTTVKTMMSPVLSASLPKTPNKALTSPANFTIKHIQKADEGQMSCVYWNGSAWLVDGCHVTHTNSTHTVCTCVHFSTYCLIMQTERPPEPDQMMELLNRILVAVGLGSLTLALLTFALCHKKTTVATPARVNLCASLLLSHLLFLLVQEFLHLISPHKVVCSVLSGVLHVLFLSSFTWMFLEIIWLLRSVLRLKQFRSAQSSGLHWGYQCLLGYGAPIAVVAISAWLVPDGYGSDKCWLKHEKRFLWSFLGPVCYFLGINTLLFFLILIILNKTLSNMRDSDVQHNLNKSVLFKTLMQSVIIGGPWILGFFTKDNKVLDLVFHVLTSQQGTFIFLLHCVLNKEVQLQVVTFCRRLR